MSKEVLQATLEELFDKHQLLPRVRQEMCGVKQFTDIMVANGISMDFGVELMAQMAIHRRCNLPTLVGLLRKFHTSSQETADAICEAADADLVDFDPTAELFVTICQLGAELQKDIDRYQYPLPLVIEPKKLENNRSTAYHHVKQGSVILRNNHHDDDVCLDHLNRCNSVKLSINQDVMVRMQNEWRNLDKPKADETVTDYRKRVKAWEKYDRSSREVMALLLTEGGNEMHLGHKYDKRGRTYCQGYHCTYQGASWNKATIELADKELI